MTADSMTANNLTADELKRKQDFDRLMAAIPDEPRGERIRSAAEWMCSTIATVYIWAAPNARKVPSKTKLRLLRREMAARGLKVLA